MAKKILTKLHNPTLAEAREFFNWTIEKSPIYDASGAAIPGFAQYKRSGGEVLHVTSETYSPAQPGEAFEKTVQALDAMGLAYTVNGAGEFDAGANIFAQFDVSATAGASKYGYNGGSFTVNGKEYKGFVTMGKGSDESFPLSYWLTIICVVCANTWRMARKARKGNAQCVTMKQTKKSAVRFETIQDEIVSIFAAQETVAQTLAKMASAPITLTEAEKAFLGLVKPVGEKQDMSKTGRTRLENTLDLYKGAFANSPGVNGGATREDWFNAVTNIATHGDTSAKAFDASKQFISSEFGTYAARKEKAFEMASDDKAWETLVATGAEIMESLLVRPVTLSQVPTVGSTDFARLIGA